VVKKRAVIKSEASDATPKRQQTTAEIDNTAGPTAGGIEGSVPGRPEETTSKKKRPVRCIQRHTDVEFRREFREVFDGLVGKAKSGGTAQTRLLLEMGGFGNPKATKRHGAKSLSEMLLDELKRRQDEREATTDGVSRDADVAVKSEAGSGGATSGDADEG
jgi:hypothetical protein